MIEAPRSILTLERPEIWREAVGMASAITGCRYQHKTPLADGTVSACGGYYRDYTPPKPPTREEIQKEIEKNQEKVERYKKEIENTGESYRRYKEIQQEIDDLTKEREIFRDGWSWHRERLRWIEHCEKKIQELEEKLNAAPAVIAVPEGSVEWLLHELGHWVAASPDERRSSTWQLGPEEYGHAADREWQAWAFEEIVLAPFGPARLLAAPQHRDGGLGRPVGMRPWDSEN